MKKATVTQENCKVLIPNKEHKNFTETNEVIPVGTSLDGNLVEIKGKRKGEDFTYKLFITPDEKIIYPKYLNMEATEVKLGADSAQTPTVVNMTPVENFNKAKLIYIAVGGAVGYGYARYKKEDWKKSLMYTVGGAILGFGLTYVIDRNRKIDVTPSK